TYWIRPPQVLSAAAGPHRFVWDLHYPPPEGPRRSYPISAIFRNTPSDPHGPWVMPGKYIVKLTVDGQSRSQPLTIKMDPRIKTPPEALTQQFQVSMQCYEGLQQVSTAQKQVRKLREQVRARRESTPAGAALDALTDLDRKAAALEGRELRREE